MHFLFGLSLINRSSTSHGPPAVHGECNNEIGRNGGPGGGEKVCKVSDSCGGTISSVRVSDRLSRSASPAEAAPSRRGVKHCDNEEENRLQGEVGGGAGGGGGSPII